MSNRHEIEGRTVHPRALAELGEDACIVALGVARDLRSGAIPPQNYNQAFYCGTSCCIGGHIAGRLGEHPEAFAVRILRRNIMIGVGDGLFCSSHPSDPILAADAIERYVFLGSETPWRK
jgi:hypothetical protein